MSMSPPPEHEGASAPVKSTNPRTLALVLGGVGCGLLFICGAVGAVVLFPVLAQARESAWTNGCLGNLRRLSASTLIYAADNDERLPGAAWMDSLSFTVQGGERVFHCPKIRSQENGAYGYAFAAYLVEKRTPDSPIPAQQAMIFDSNFTARNAVGPPSSAPMPPRHSRGRPKGNNTAFLDGHVEFLPVDAAR